MTRTQALRMAKANKARKDRRSRQRLWMAPDGKVRSIEIPIFTKVGDRDPGVDGPRGDWLTEIQPFLDAMPRPTTMGGLIEASLHAYRHPDPAIRFFRAAKGAANP